MNEGIYYLRLNGRVEAPYSIGQIYDLWAARKINSQTLFARFEEMEKWQPLSDLTLKISAPKMLSQKPPVAESAPAPAAKPKVGSSPSPPSVSRSDEYASSAAYPMDQRTGAPEAKRKILPLWVKNAIFNFSFSIGFCIVIGACVTAYSMFFFSASPDGKEVSQHLLIEKQSGIIAGIGLVLMGGLLLIARQLAQILASLKSEGTSPEGRKKSPSSSWSESAKKTNV